jgi:23S rRNA (pseudouridine1915-N3)-methyltransferase
VRIVVAAVGRLKSGPERELFDRFFDRAGRAGQQLGLTVDLREIPESTARQAATRKSAEAEALLALLPSGAIVAALDEHGTVTDSRAFAERIAKWRDSGVRDLAFVVGGADGLAEAAIDRADLTIAFGRMTWPHQLVRIMLAEQLYRAVTILAGHPYHRA